MTDTLTRPVPARIEATDSLSRDVVTTAGVGVHAGSPRPVAPFHNVALDTPREDLRHELLVIASTPDGPRIVHLSQVPDGQGARWTSREVFAEICAKEPPTEVVVVRAPLWDVQDRPRQLCVFVAGGKVYSSALSQDGLTWSAPVPHDDLDGFSGLTVTHSALGGTIANQFRPVVSLSAIESGGGGTVVCLVPTPDGEVVVGCSYPSGGEVSHAVVFGPSPEYQDAPWAYAFSRERDVVSVAVGKLGHEKRLDYPRPAERVLAAAADAERAFFLVQESDGSVCSWTLGADGSQPVPPRPLGAPKVRFRHAEVENAGEPGRPLWSVYAVDESGRLWAVHQHDTKPLLSDGTPSGAITAATAPQA